MRALFLFLLLLIAPVSQAANYFYPTGSYANAETACYSFQTRDNHYYCQLVILTTNVVNTSNNFIGSYQLRNAAGTLIDQHYFGYTGSVKPSNYTCPFSSTYNATTGFCSAITQGTTYFCSGALGGHGIQAVFETYVTGLGCQYDQDSDGFLQYQDNCPDTYNHDQIDSDGDSIGDACDNCIPDAYSADYSAPGYYIDNPPISYCDSNKCTVTLRVSQCFDGICQVSYKPNGPQCATTNTPNITGLIYNTPESYGFNLNADNASFVMSRGLQTKAPSNHRFIVTNCTISTSNISPYYLSTDWQNTNNAQRVSCNDITTYNQCVTANEIDQSIATYIRSHPLQTSTSGPIMRYYDYYLEGEAMPGVYSLLSDPDTLDPNFGTDNGQGTYNLTIKSTSARKTFPPYSATSSTAPLYPMRLALKGCTDLATVNNPGSGTSTSDPLSATQTPVSLSELNGLMTNLDTFIGNVSNVGVEFNSKYNNEVAPTQVVCTTDCNPPKETPSFISNILLAFQSQGTCQVLNITKYGTTTNIFANLCQIYDTWGRPFLAFWIYYITLISIANIWFSSSPKAN